MSVVTIRIEVDDDKLHAYGAALYDPGEEVPADVGVGLLKDWVSEFNGALDTGGFMDTIWFEPRNPYVTRASIEVTP